MNIYRLISILFLLTTLYTGAVKGMTLSEFNQGLEDINEQNTNSETFVFRLVDMVHMLVVYTNDLKSKGMPMLFCPPENLEMQLLDIIQLIKKQSHLGGESEQSLVQNILLDSLMHTFPCRRI